MKELPRLREERGSALEHALLGAGASPVASAELRAKTLSALGLAGSVTLVAGTAAVGPMTSLLKVGWGKLLLGISLAGAAAAVPVTYGFLRRGSDDVPGVPAQAGRPSGPASVSSGEAAPPALSKPSEVTASARLVPDARPRASRVTLVHELAELDAVRATLAAGDAREALALLDIYQDRFPHGRLDLEAEVLRIDALMRSGQREAARRHAQAFVRRHPQSVLVARVRAEANLD